MTEDELLPAARRLPARTIMALTVDAEARGEPERGRIAVLWVIRRRAEQWHKTIADVCLGPKQFSCWNPGRDANHLRLLWRVGRIVAGQIDPDVRWMETCRLADDVLAGRAPDPTGGALYYCTPAVLTSPETANGWFARAVAMGTLREQKRIGGHVFFVEAPREVRA